jgi:hypothetical protein
MVDNGYKPVISASIVASASTIGPVIPPSIPFVLYGALTECRSPALRGRLLPGIIMGLALMLVLAIMAKPRGFPRSERANMKEVWDSFKAAFLPLLAPVIIIGGILTGIFTPTEASHCLHLRRDPRIRVQGFETEGPAGDILEIHQAEHRLLFIMAAASFSAGWSCTTGSPTTS